jgi:hypothetical protein
MKINNPLALSWKYPKTEGICTRGGEITALPDSIVLDQAACDAIDAEYQAHLDATAYIDKRQAEYPAIGDQLDALWKARQGNPAEADAMALDIAAVKNKYPK